MASSDTTTTTTTTTDGSNPLTEISNATELDYYLRGALLSSSSSDNNNNGIIVIVTFSTHWCGPCQRSKPKLIEMAQKYNNNNKDSTTTSIHFAYVPETDMNDDFIEEYNINAFPTYICFKQGDDDDGTASVEEVDRVEGANLEQVETMIQNHHFKK